MILITIIRGITVSKNTNLIPSDVFEGMNYCQACVLSKFSLHTYLLTVFNHTLRYFIEVYDYLGILIPYIVS